MIGNKYWSTGMTIDYNPYGELWFVTTEFFDDGWCNDESTEGKIHSRYWSKDLTTLIDNVKTDVEKLGIEWQENSKIYIRQDDGGEFPDNWKETLKAQADRIGFRFPYQVEVENV